MKPLKFCYNGDGNPVCPPSKVLCRKCLDGISNKLEDMVKNFPSSNQEREVGKP